MFERLNMIDRVFGPLLIQFFDLLSNMRTAGILLIFGTGWDTTSTNQIERTFTMESLILAQDER